MENQICEVRGFLRSNLHMDRSMFTSIKRKCAEVEWLFKLLTLLPSLFFYPMTIAIVTLYLRLGGLSWLVIAGFLALPTIAWFIIMKRRVDRYLNWLMNNKPREWNVAKTVREYLALLKKQREHDE